LDSGDLTPLNHQQKAGLVGKVRDRVRGQQVLESSNELWVERNIRGQKASGQKR
jgi:hypothetical protein